MSSTLTTAAIAGGVLLAGGSAVAGYQMLSASRGAEVVSATAVTKTHRIPRQECHDEEVTRTKPVKDQNRLVGTGIGAVVGGLLGNQIGGGSGKALATVAGAAAGGYAGNTVQKKVQQGDTYTSTEQRCTTVYDSEEVPAGYDVVYLLKGKEHHVHLDHDPGRRLPVKDGKVVLEADRSG